MGTGSDVSTGGERRGGRCDDRRLDGGGMGLGRGGRLDETEKRETRAGGDQNGKVTVRPSDGMARPGQGDMRHG